MSKARSSGAYVARHALPLLALCACTAPPTASDPDGPPALHVDAGRLLDAEGRQILLRGVNARVEGLFDVSFDDGRVALEAVPAFGADDCRFLAEALGLDHLRLPVNWSGIEPRSGSYDEAYLERIGAQVDACAAVGVWTVVDLHQDAYGKDIGEDGAPLWAIHPAPEVLLEGPLASDDLARRRTSPAVLQAFDSLYGNATLADGRGVRDAYAEMAAVLAETLREHPGAVALELQNEPVALGQQDRLDAFHDAVTAAVREVAPELPVVFEPDALRNLLDRAPVDTPFPWSDAFYGPHIYTDVFEDGWASEDSDAVVASIRGAHDEAQAHDAHLYVGEFGHDPTTERGRTYLSTCLDAFDDHQASWALWLYEEHSQDAWGLWDEGDVPHTRGALRTPAADLLARAYPIATAGRLVEVDWTAAARTLTVRFDAPTGGAHWIATPLRTFPDGVDATCDGAPAEVRPLQPGRVEVDCSGAELRVAPKG